MRQNCAPLCAAPGSTLWLSSGNEARKCPEFFTTTFTPLFTTRFAAANVQFLGNENSAQSFSDRSFWKSLRVVDVRDPKVMDVRAQMLVFPGFWAPWPKFWAGISARMTPGCPRDVLSKNFLFGLIFLPWISWPFLGNASLFTKFLFTIFVPLNPPPFPTSKMEDFLLNFYKRTSSRIANTQPKSRTNPPKIANKQNYEQTGIPEHCRTTFSRIWRGVARELRYTLCQSGPVAPTFSALRGGVALYRRHVCPWLLRSGPAAGPLSCYPALLQLRQLLGYYGALTFFPSLLCLEADGNLTRTVSKYWSSFPCFFGFPCFFHCKEFPCFFERFSLLSQGF